ncbi:hypothetical protein LMG28688_05675 [Paraburkholderia caffeinitolerans]|uniref:Uncharacterized protein n=1 Tax=Paraburkholderia caffeinitolerans TaxID=1723730 RepID=A0A6J5GNZ2_9BURK|nr:hypothetical protein [Paraburkholderia caffeinitolerans]CAB3802969.1 hypothetical protein LMG28688_05675 [Paraburkholderia caffeinitolerans]
MSLGKHEQRTYRQDVLKGEKIQEPPEALPGGLAYPAAANGRPPVMGI